MAHCPGRDCCLGTPCDQRQHVVEYAEPGELLHDYVHQGQFLVEAGSMSHATDAAWCALRLGFAELKKNRRVTADAHHDLLICHQLRRFCGLGSA